MTLDAGARLGPYEIVDPLGAGGMGEVYRARDTRLGRDVAIKVLPEHLSTNPEVRARFEREAKTISGFNHPHICTLFDVGQEGDTHYLVMELIEGQTLADRLDRGPLPTEEVLRIGSQIADALDRAHRAGVVHRDLKPGNVMLTKSGAKLMDFGLARPTVMEAAESGRSASPTMSRPLTAEGTIVGTFQYMAPEQLEGKESDARSDLWALGCVLYEMATGKCAFTGGSQASLIARIMQSDPAPMHGLQPLTPPALEHLVQACLAKDPADRVQSAHDVKLQLNWIAEGGSQAGVPAPTAARRRGRERLAWALIGVLVVVLGILLGQRILVRSEAPPVLRLSVAPPSETTLLNEPVYFSISPDGRYLAMVGADSSGTDRLWIREIGALEPRLLPGTEGALQSFWAPDSRSLCFSTLDRLKRISVDGGSPQVVAPIQQHGRGGSWGPNDTLLIAAAPEGPIYKVSAGGGELTQVTRLDSLETGHRCPHFLPDGRHFLFASLPGKPLYDIYFGDMRTGERKRLFSADGVPEFVEPGLLTYVQNDRIVAQRFDPEQGTLLGDPIAIGDEPAATVMAGKNRFSASRTGTILYIRGRMVNTDLVRTDIAGRRLGTLPCPTGRYTGTRLSPNGDRVALVKRITSSEDELWTYDLARNSALRLTTGSEQIDSPVWSPDGERIAFASNRDGNWNLYLLDAHGRSPAEQIVESSALFKFPWAWSPDGKFLVYAELARETAWDLWVLPLDGAPTPQPYLQTPADENQARFSPDGRWLVFTSTETGRFEVVVRSFPDASQRYTVSQNGGQYPIWTADGTKIYFVSPAGELMVSEVSVSSDGFRATRPRKTGLIASPDFVTADVAPDGSFVLHSLAAEESPGNVPLTVLMNWREHLSDK